jgi:hypothetical protein
VTATAGVRPWLFGACRLEAADRGYRPNGLACDRGDHIKVTVVVADRKTGDFSAGRDQKIRDFDLTLSPLDNQFMPYVHSPIPSVLVVGDLRQRIKVTAKVFELALGLGRPQKLHDDHRTRRDFIGEDPLFKVPVNSRVFVPVRPGARVREFQPLRASRGADRDSCRIL